MVALGGQRLRLLLSFCFNNPRVVTLFIGSKMAQHDHMCTSSQWEGGGEWEKDMT